MTQFAFPAPVAALVRPIAHRGLHNAERGFIENTRDAFEAAIAAGHGIECDLRPAAGGIPMVFHDDTLDRLMLATGPVNAHTPAALKTMSFRAPAARNAAPMMTFADALSLVAGRAPLLVEIKSEWEPPDAAFLANIAKQANAYDGPLGLMSFDPAIVAAMAYQARQVPRGLISGSYRSAPDDTWWADKLSPQRAAHLRDLAEVEAVGASFVAYEVCALNTPPVIAVRSRGLAIFTWTVRTPADWTNARTFADAPIFEGRTPD
jgi:glycerophosphoryl diester phosphodiesterase